MEQEKEYTQQLMEANKELLLPLLRFLPWLAQNAGHSVSTDYQGQDVNERSLSFPIYDGTLMSFIREASKSPLMEKNYQYIYTRNHIKTHDDEKRIITSATWKEWDILRGILSKYVMGGRVKATLWNEAAQEQIFYLVLKKMKEIIEFWGKSADDRLR